MSSRIIGNVIDLIDQAATEAVGFGVGTALGRALEPEAIGLAQDSWRGDQLLALDPQTLALLVRLGIRDGSSAADEATSSGINGSRFSDLVAALRAPPPTAELIELVRRGKLDAASLPTWLERAGVDDRLSGALADLQHLRLAPADVANGVQQGFLPNPGLIAGAPSQGGLLAIDPIAEALDAGLDETRFRLLCELVGLPPGIAEGLELLRRADALGAAAGIDEARFRQYVAEGHTKTKYGDDLLKLKRTYLSPAVYAEALLRHRILEPDAVQGAAIGGLSKDDFLLWSSMLGRPPGIGEALTLVNREIPGPRGSAASLAYFTDVVARSDVRTEFADDLYNLRIHYPSLFQISRAIQNGAVSDTLARDTLLAEGYPAEWADAIVAAGHKVKTSAHKQLALAVVETAADAGLITGGAVGLTHSAALAAIESLGYDAPEAEQLLDLHEARRLIAEIGHGVTIVRSRYVGWKIDAAVAQAELRALTLPQDQVDRLLTFWAAEREANRPTLTAAEIVAGNHYGRYTYTEASQALQALGWSEDHALTLLWNRAHGDPRL